jgi:hypothetical protein
MPTNELDRAPCPSGLGLTRDQVLDVSATGGLEPRDRVAARASTRSPQERVRRRSGRCARRWCGTEMTRAGFEYLLRKHAATARAQCPSLQGKRISAPRAPAHLRARHPAGHGGHSYGLDAHRRDPEVSMSATIPPDGDPWFPGRTIQGLVGARPWGVRFPIPAPTDPRTSRGGDPGAGAGPHWGQECAGFVRVPLWTLPKPRRKRSSLSVENSWGSSAGVGRGGPRGWT